MTRDLRDEDPSISIFDEVVIDDDPDDESETTWGDAEERAREPEPPWTPSEFEDDHNEPVAQDDPAEEEETP